MKLFYFALPILMSFSVFSESSFDIELVGSKASKHNISMRLGSTVKTKDVELKVGQNNEFECHYQLTLNGVVSKTQFLKKRDNDGVNDIVEVMHADEKQVLKIVATSSFSRKLKSPMSGCLPYKSAIFWSEINFSFKRIEYYVLSHPLVPLKVVISGAAFTLKSHDSKFKVNDDGSLTVNPDVEVMTLLQKESYGDPVAVILNTDSGFYTQETQEDGKVAWKRKYGFNEVIRID